MSGFTENAAKPAPVMKALLSALAGDPEENLRRMHEQCIRAIERGDTYGWPPLMVADCRKIIAERVALTDVEHLGPGRIAA